MSSLNDLFREMVPNGIRLKSGWDYWSMPLDKLAKHVEYNEEAARVYKTRSSKLGKYLEGHE